MLIRKAYKYQLKTNTAQAEMMSRFAGCCRFVWNKALGMQKDRLERKEKMLRYGDEALLLKLWRQSEEYGFLKDTHSQVLQQVLKDQERAFKNFFEGRSEFPRFKKKGYYDSFRYPQGFKVDGNKVYLPKIGWIRFRKSREIEGTIKNVTVSRSAGKWYMSMQVEMEVPNPVHQASSWVAGDMGIKRFLTLSDGTVYEPVNSFKKLEKKLAMLQKALCRKNKRSKNWQKQVKRVQGIHSRIANIRNDFLHKTSTEISKKHAVIFLEDLKVSNMSASAKGTLENPGKSVKQKAGLNKSILDQGWFEFRRQLEYKQIWNGGMVMTVPPQYTSQTCPVCGHVSKDNRMTQAEFRCTNCGYENNADLVGAMNVLRAGHAQLACGEMAH